MSKLFQTVGVLALLAWTGVGIFAWAKTSSGLHVTLSEADGGAQLERVALLDDRVDTLAADVDALIGSLDASLSELVGSLEQESVANAIERARLEERVAALEQALPSAMGARETAGALSATLARLQQLSLEAPAAAVVAPLAPIDEPPPTAQTEPARAEGTPAPDTTQPPESASTEEPAAPTPKRSFLSFSLPARDFQFEGRQRFEVLGDLSRVGFDAKSTLHDFSGVSNAVRGDFAVDLADTAAGIEGEISIDTDSLGTGLDSRDEAMLEHLEPETYEDIRFEPLRFVSHRVDPKTRTISGVVEGKLTLQGTTQEVSMGVEAHVDESRRLVIEGEMPLQLDDYAVPVPNKLGVVTMEHEVRIWIHLRTRATQEGR